MIRTIGERSIIPVSGMILRIGRSSGSRITLIAFQIPATASLLHVDHVERDQQAQHELHNHHDDDDVHQVGEDIDQGVDQHGRGFLADGMRHLGGARLISRAEGGCINLIIRFVRVGAVYALISVPAPREVKISSSIACGTRPSSTTAASHPASTA